MFIDVEKKMAFAPIDRITSAIWLFLLIIISFALALAFYFARTISNPVNRLIEGSEIIGGGNLDHKVGTDAKDEIGQLSRAFDEMTRNLKAITKKRDEAMETLRKSEADLTEAQRIALLGGWEWDILKNELKWTDYTYRLLGLKPGEKTPSYKVFMELIHPDDREKVKTASKLDFERKAPYKVEFRIVKKGGEERIIYSQGETQFDENGKPVKRVGIAQDITERKKAEEKLENAYKELADRNEDLESFHRVAVGRELEMIRLKEEVNSLLEKSEQPKKYEEVENIDEEEG